MAANRKVVGSAQLRRGTALLQHGSILLDDDQRTVGALALVRPGTDNAPARAMQAGALSAIMGRQLTIPEAAGAVTRAASASWGGAWNRRADPTEVLRGASRHYPQFRSSAWTWAR